MVITDFVVAGDAQRGGDPDGRARILERRDESDLESVLDSVSATLREKTLPFLEVHRDVAALNAGCNPPGAEDDHRRVGDEPFSVGDWQSFNAMGTPARQINALVLARLAGDPRFSALARAYSAQVSNCRAPERRDLRASRGGAPRAYPAVRLGVDASAKGRSHPDRHIRGMCAKNSMLAQHGEHRTTWSSAATLQLYGGTLRALGVVP